ncbi:MAG: hypothetical protein AVDCRST_MAG38-2952 [uncultured Solirubrobacteraceae bacterium]|uniref:Uncharacterized protein n=1 Tax=uncultured Solirubrobacteraceae bacterium TaxID=1162706 RepID=A0A6J4SEU6_9ACTN|nr:MAG: hypothetical protein AVDCRST_MAG38-2952 [uncultured Solirubrobacteraceae bacterium]
MQVPPDLPDDPRRGAGRPPGPATAILDGGSGARDEHADQCAGRREREGDIPHQQRLDACTGGGHGRDGADGEHRYGGDEPARGRFGAIVAHVREVGWRGRDLSAEGRVVVPPEARAGRAMAVLSGDRIRRRNETTARSP